MTYPEVVHWRAGELVYGSHSQPTECRTRNLSIPFTSLHSPWGVTASVPPTSQHAGQCLTNPPPPPAPRAPPLPPWHPLLWQRWQAGGRGQGPQMVRCRQVWHHLPRRPSHACLHTAFIAISGGGGVYIGSSQAPGETQFQWVGAGGGVPLFAGAAAAPRSLSPQILYVCCPCVACEQRCVAVPMSWLRPNVTWHHGFYTSWHLPGPHHSVWCCDFTALRRMHADGPKGQGRGGGSSNACSFSQSTPPPHPLAQGRCGKS